MNSWNLGCTMRATRAVVPPGGNGTITRTGFDGYACASARQGNSRIAASRRLVLISKPLDPGTKFELPRPGAAVLAVHVKVVPGDLVGQQHAVLAPLIRARVSRRLADPAVDDEMRDVDAFRRQLARHALRKAAQRKLAHREGRGVRVPLHARRGAGEENRARAARQHALCRRLADQKAGEGADRERALDFLRLDLGDRPA